MENLKRLAGYLPTLLIAFLLSVAVWILAVTSADPTETRTYPRAVPVEIIGLDPAMVITSSLPTQINLSLSAPRSIWNELTANTNSVRAVLDLAGLDSGTHELDIQVQVGVRPVRIVTYTPRQFTITLERLSSQTMPIELAVTGGPAIGYQAGDPELSATNATVSGPQSLVARVSKVRAALELNQVRESFSRTLTLQAVDTQNVVVSGVTLSPDKITLNQTITQRGGYRNVIVKVTVSGQVAYGYRLTNISVFPPAVTVFSTDPTLVDNLPGFIETLPVDLTGAQDDIETLLALNLPEGISVVDSPSVQVQVGIAAIEGSLRLPNQAVEVIGLPPELSATLSTQTVDVILAGPLPLLDQLKPDDLRVVLDLTNLGPGKYTLSPRVVFNKADLRPESILPPSIEVVVSIAPTPTRAPAKP